MSEIITVTTTEQVLVGSTGEQLTLPGPATHTVVTVGEQGPPGVGGGTVTLVDVTVPTGLSVSGVPISTTGTVAIGFASGYSLPTNAQQSQWSTAYGWGNHASVGYLMPAAIGVTVQGYSANLSAWAALATSAKQDTLVSGTHIKTINGGSLLGAGDVALVRATAGAASGLTLNDGYTEEVFAISGTAPVLSPDNGSIQTWTLTANSTPTAGTWASGQSITLMIDDGTARTITWTSLAVSWKTNTGSAPTLNTTGLTAIALWKVGSTIYGARVGDA